VSAPGSIAADRALFLDDFILSNIKETIFRPFKIAKYEKKEINSARTPVYRDAGLNYRMQDNI